MKTFPDRLTRVFLLICAAGLTPIALSYGAAPSVSLNWLFGIRVDSLELTHVFRAVMGLYLGMVVLWIGGAFNRRLTAPALVSCAVFMLGLAAGRIVSFVLDGRPHALLVVYAGLEIVFGFLAVRLFLRNRKISGDI